VIVTAFESIDWADESMAISKHFSVGEAIGLRHWNRLATPADGMTAAVQRALFDFLTGAMDELLDVLASRALVHCTYRPPAYNKLPAIGGASASAHQCLGPWAAMDFEPISSIAEKLSCDAVRQRVLAQGLLEQLSLRMEDRRGSGWIHIDNHPPGPAGRFFRP
jgi:hypothetical protein